MKKLSALLLTSTLFLAPLCGCAQTSTQTQPDQAQSDKRYDDVIADLEEEDYDGAIATITEMKKEAQAKAHADMEEYLVTVELTKENFDEYFEWVTIPRINAFGEQEGARWGLRSKKYDDGLILYGLDDQNYCDSITLKYTVTMHYPSGSDWSDQENTDLSTLLCIQRGCSGDAGEEVSVDVNSLDRIAGSRLTFIKKEFIESYDIELAEHPDDPVDSFFASATITLKNGETFYSAIARDYPY